MSSSIAAFAEKVSPCLRLGGSDGDVVLSTRVRLARNLQGCPFPGRAGADELQETFAAVARAAKVAMDEELGLEKSISDMSMADRNFLVERRLISSDLASRGAGSGVLSGLDEQLVVMINEEDHLRCHSVYPGCDIEKPLRAVTGVVNEIESELPVAFSKELGYLTACPTNLGTGLRISIMMHLPALVFCGQEEKIFRAAGQLGLAVRGLFGEGTNPTGNLYQLSNQSTLGEDEATISSRLERISSQLVRAERSARNSLLRASSMEFTDYIARAYATLKYARVITAEEALDKLFALRLGLLIGMFDNRDLSPVHDLIQLVMPEHLQLHLHKDLKDTDRDIERAVLIRRKITYI
ncbi:MAG: ATP--guanido phosphotransferase [Lentisphaeria bacterium]